MAAGTASPSLSEMLKSFEDEFSLFKKPHDPVPNPRVINQNDYLIPFPDRRRNDGNANPNVNTNSNVNTQCNNSDRTPKKQPIYGNLRYGNTNENRNDNNISVIPVGRSLSPHHYEQSPPNNAPYLHPNGSLGVYDSIRNGRSPTPNDNYVARPSGTELGWKVPASPLLPGKLISRATSTTPPTGGRGRCSIPMCLAVCAMILSAAAVLTTLLFMAYIKQEMKELESSNQYMGDMPPENGLGTTSNSDMIVVETPSPCAVLFCAFGAKCVEDVFGGASCQCVETCVGEDFNPLCGSNGVVYDNECFLRQVSCAEQRRITVVSMGNVCGDEPTEVWPSYGSGMDLYWENEDDDDEVEASSFYDLNSMYPALVEPGVDTTTQAGDRNSSEATLGHGPDTEVDKEGRLDLEINENNFYFL